MTTSAISPPQYAPAAPAARLPQAEPPLPSSDRLAFRAAPLLGAALLFSGGILLARVHWFAPAQCGLAVLALAAIAALGLPRPTRAVYVALAALWLLLGVFAAETEPQPPPQRELLALADGAPHSVTGTVVKSGPDRRIVSYAPFSDISREETTRAADLQIRSVSDKNGKPVPVSGGLRLSIYAAAGQSLPSLACGDMVSVLVTLRPAERYRDPGVWNSSAWLLAQGIGALGTAKTANLKVLPGTAPPTLSCRIHALQQKWSRSLLAFAGTAPRLPGWLTLSPDDAAMLSAMVTGDRTWLTRALRTDFERTGSFHLLVVSGLHLGLFAALIFQFGRWLRLSSALTVFCTLALSTGYALLTGFGQPVQRALAMVGLYLLARLLFRERASLNALGFAALCLLVFSPRSLFDTGLQMTLLSVVAIGGIAKPAMDATFGPYLHGTKRISLVALDPSLPPRVAQFRVTLRLLGAHLTPTRGHKPRSGAAILATASRVVLRVAEVIFVSAVIELTMALPMAAYFHRVTVFGIPVNVLIVPLLGILLPCAFLTLLCLLAAPALAFVPGAMTAAVLHVTTAIVHSFARLDGGGLRIPGPSPVQSILCLSLLACAVFAVRKEGPGLKLAAVATLAAAFILVLPRPATLRPHTLEVTAIDVGQGDSLLVVSPSGKTLLVDAGGRLSGSGPNQSNFDVGEDVVSPYLWSRGVRCLDAVALTHAHSDHMGGMFAVLRDFRPRELWVGRNPGTPDYEALLAEARTLGIALRSFTAGDSFEFGQAQVHVLAPSPDYQPGLRAANNDSLVLHVAYGRTSALLEGDAEAPSEARMLGEPGLRADLLKVGHHGSKTSSTVPFLEAVHPRYAVISVGLYNSYHHPRWETLARLQDRHALTWRTDLLGMSTFYLDGTEVIPLR